MSNGSFIELLPKRCTAIHRNPFACDWLEVQFDLQAPINTLSAYAYDLNDFLDFCSKRRWKLSDVNFKRLSKYIADLNSRPVPPGTNRRNRQTQIGLAPSTARRRISTVCQFYDYLCGEDICTRNPVRGSSRRVLVPLYEDVPWIPDDTTWLTLVNVVVSMSLRNRAMFALNYDTGLRKQELCALRLGDFDHAERAIKIRAETTKNRRSRIVVYGASTDALLTRYLQTLPRSVKNSETIFRSESRRNFGQPITVHAWTQVIKSIAICANVPQFHPHTLRHLCLTDLARSGWDLPEIRAFAGHKSLKTTSTYIHLSGRELKEKYRTTMTQLHAERVALLSITLGGIS